MVQKRSFCEQESCEFPSKQPRCAEPNCQLVSVLENSQEPVFAKADASGGDGDNYTGIKPVPDKKLDNHNVAEGLSSSDMGIHGSASNSSWPTSSTSEEEIRSEAPFHILTSPEHYYRPFRAAAHPREMYSSIFSNPPQKLVPIGPDFQAELPEWGACDNNDRPNLESMRRALSFSSQADENKLVGTSIIQMPEMELLTDHGENIGVGRVECLCEDIGSIRCVRLHVKEAREKLKLAIGEETFVRLGFCDMGEVVADKWSEEEELLFLEVVISNPASLGKNFWNYLGVAFPSLSRQELVSYYFNVFILRKRAEQNRFDPVDVDSDDDEWQVINGAADEEANMADEDEDSVVESPAYHNDLSYYGIYGEHDKQTYTESANDATLEDYNKPVNFASREVVTDMLESCPSKLFDNKSSYKLSVQPQDRGLSNGVCEQDGSCTANSAWVTSQSSLGKTDNGKHWVSDVAGMGKGREHDSVMGPCSVREWGGGYLSCAKKEVDLLPTHTMIEEVFGDGEWIYKS